MKHKGQINMKIEEIRDLCTGCTACQSVCPQKCITMQYDDEGFQYPYIDKEKCVECGLCKKTCHCISTKYYAKPSVHYSYMGKSLDEEVLKICSSGGAFYHIANNIINKGGVVFGAAFDYNDKLLKHTSSDDTSLKNLLKSKYVESALGDTIAKIQNSIDSGRKALFCGTPCQVSGVKSAVKDPNDLLLLCDFVCHGVPSAILFKEHLEKLCKDEEIINIDFRPKEVPWERKYIRVTSCGREYFRPYDIDSFYYGFMACNAYLRKSCYHCNFRDYHVSDITLADFWGWKKYDPNLHPEKGLSLLVANSAKGKQIIEKTEGMSITPIDNIYSDYIYSSKDYSNGARLREQFYKLYHEHDFEQAAKMTYFKDGKTKILKYFVKKSLHKEL